MRRDGAGTGGSHRVRPCRPPEAPVCRPGSPACSGADVQGAGGQGCGSSSPSFAHSRWHRTRPRLFFALQPPPPCSGPLLSPPPTPPQRAAARAGWSRRDVVRDVAASRTLGCGRGVGSGRPYLHPPPERGHLLVARPSALPLKVRAASANCPGRWDDTLLGAAGPPAPSSGRDACWAALVSPSQDRAPEFTRGSQGPSPLPAPLTSRELPHARPQLAASR